MSSDIVFDLMEELKSRVNKGTQILSQGSPGYDDSIKRWSDLASKPAGIVIFPESPQDVSETVRFAQEKKLDLAVKCGGHSTDGSSSSDGGIVIDLGKMRDVTIDTQNETVSAQGGALWADINDAAAKFKLAVVGGTVSHTGVGGVTLQGGYGFLTPQQGLVIDNLISARVIVAGGQQLTASQTENPDLFWAIRGAGQSFGVVVDFTFQARKQRCDVWAGSLTFLPDKLSAVIESLNSTLQYPDPWTAAQCVFVKPPESSTPLVEVVIFYNGPESDGRRRFAGLFDLEATSSDVRMRPYKDANTISNPGVPPGGRKTLTGLIYAPPVRPEFARELLDELAIKIQADPDLAHSFIDLDFFDMSEVCKVPTTSMAFPSRRMTQNGVLVLQWTNANKDQANLAWADKIRIMCENEFIRAGYKPNMHVSNFSSYTESCNATVSDMFGVNEKRLLEVKNKYDPQGLFNKLNPIKRVTERKG